MPDTKTTIGALFRRMRKIAKLNMAEAAAPAIEVLEKALKFGDERITEEALEMLRKLGGET